MTSVRVCSFFKTGPLWDFTTFAFAIRSPLLPPTIPHPSSFHLEATLVRQGHPQG